MFVTFENMIHCSGKGQCTFAPSFTALLQVCTCIRTGGVHDMPGSLLVIWSCELPIHLCLSTSTPVTGADSSYPVCEKPADEFGDHFVWCGGNRDCSLCHNSPRGSIFATAHFAALSPKLEVLLVIPGRCPRQADVYVHHWMHGLPAALDVITITSRRLPQPKAMLYL